MKWSMLILAVLFAPSAGGAEALIRVVNEEGQPIERFEAAVVYKNVLSNERGINGTLKLYRANKFLDDSWALNVLVCANGYAPATRTFVGEEKHQLRDGGATIVLERGREVRLRLKLPGGMQLPAKLVPQVYFPEFASHARMNWRDGDRRFRPNGIIVRAAGNNEFLFRLPSEHREFLVGIDRPGWLRFFEGGPFTIDDSSDGTLQVDVPQPASIDVSFDWAGFDAADLPFDRVQLDFGWRIRGRSGSIRPVLSESQHLEMAGLRVDDLAPGAYRVQVATQTDDREQVGRSGQVDPTRFMERHLLELSSGEARNLRIVYRPFDPDAFRGNRTVRVKLLAPDGSPAAGKSVTIDYIDGHYGVLTVFEGLVPPDGIVLLEGITDRVPPGNWPGPYAVQLDDGEVRKRTLAYFRLEPSDVVQDFKFQVISTPDAGDGAPDVEIAQLGSTEKLRISDLRGKIVFIEFWATWCAPCQEPMEKLNEIAARKSDWGSEVALVPISIDEELDAVAPHVELRAWTNLRHCWNGEDAAPSQLSAKSAFVVSGVPTAFLIDRDGIIAWRGHPTAIDVAARIDELLEKDHER